MREKKGITLLTLGVGVVILLLISGVSINVGMQTYRVMQVENFIAKMKMVQSKVDELVEQGEDGSKYAKLGSLNDSSDTEKKKVYEKFISNIDIIIKNSNPTSWKEGDDNIENYCVFSAKDLEDIMGLKNIDLTVIVNFSTRQVISLNGVNQNGQTYYRMYDLEGGEKIY